MGKYIIAFLVGLTIIVLPKVSETPSIIETAHGSVIEIANAASQEVSTSNAGTTIATLPIVPKIYQVWVTAYSSDPAQTDSTPFITASNEHVRDGIIAANFLPFGTKLKIPAVFGDKIFTVEDRMAERKKNFVDVWMSTKSAAVDFGITQADVVVVDN